MKLPAAVHAGLASCFVATAAFAQEQNMLDGAGTDARYTEGLWWWMVAVLAVVYVVVAVAIFAAVLRRREPAARGSIDPAPRERIEKPLRLAVAISTAVTAAILVTFLVVSLRVEQAISSVSSEPPNMSIKVTGYQWWWEIEYPDPEPVRTVITANEIHLPVGVPVELQLVAADVIHSFWAPSLAGKIDLIPGRDNELWIKAERPGEFRGQCAEFCGLQHAHMRFLVVAEPEAEFHAWLDRQRQPAPDSAGDLEKRGRQVFETGPCAMCHTIKGTQAAGRNAPDLTHVASRRLIGAGSFPNEREHLAKWVTDAQSLKPGSNMPPVPLEPGDLDALLAFLGTLK